MHMQWSLAEPEGSNSSKSIVSALEIYWSFPASLLAHVWTGNAQEHLITIMVAFLVGMPGNRRRTSVEVPARPGTGRIILCVPVYLPKAEAQRVLLTQLMGSAKPTVYSTVEVMVLGWKGYLMLSSLQKKPL